MIIMNEGLTDNRKNSIFKDIYGFPAITGKHTALMDAVNANPDRSKGGPYIRNCAYCVAAFELRRRGFNVEANPQDRLYGDIWDKMFKNFRLIPVTSRDEAGLVLELSRKALLWGDGARGCVYAEWSTYGAHVFSVEVSGGKVMFIDPQMGISDAVSHFKKVKPESALYGRHDNLELTENLRIACRARGEWG
jgi:hypothetical protein